MGKQEPHIDYEKIAQYLSGELSGVKLQELEDWINQSEENKQVIAECREVFSLEYHNNQDSSLIFDRGDGWQKVQNRIANNPVVEFIPEQEASKPLFKQTWIRIAAIIVLALASTLFFIKTQQDKIITITAQDSILEFILPDSSRVVLKPKASIAYAPSFGSDNRSLQLTGTAYFDVKRDTTLLFSIQAGKGLVEVLGTAFVVEDLQDTMAVTVERGQVKLQAVDNANVTVILNRNDKGQLISTAKINETTVSSLNSLYWANNTLSYRQERLFNVFNELEVVFDQQIHVDSATIKNCRISAVFKNENFGSIMNNLALSLDFEYIVSGNTVTVISDGCTEN